MKVIVINEEISRDHPFGRLFHATREVDTYGQLFLGRGYGYNLDQEIWVKASVIGSVIKVPEDAVPAEYRTYLLLLNP